MTWEKFEHKKRGRITASVYLSTRKNKNALRWVYLKFSVGFCRNIKNKKRITLYFNSSRQIGIYPSKNGIPIMKNRSGGKAVSATFFWMKYNLPRKNLKRIDLVQATHPDIPNETLWVLQLPEDYVKG
jgi:hypothetical protein